LVSVIIKSNPALHTEAGIKQKNYAGKQKRRDNSAQKTHQKRFAVGEIFPHIFVFEESESDA
jgi:hypothetical protein